MKRTLQWLTLALLLLVALLAAGVWALQRWVEGDDFRARAEREASAALGVKVKLARIGVDVWPLPALAVAGVQVDTRPALTLERLVLRPAWSGLLRGRLELATLLLHGVTLPQGGIDAVLVALQKKKRETTAAKRPETAAGATLPYIPARTVLDSLTWVSAQGTRITLDADVRLSPQGLPDDVSVQFLKGALQGGSARLQREGNAWSVDMRVGGGTIKGAMQLQPAAQSGAKFSIKGQLETRAVEVAALTDAPQPVLSGRLEADTTFSGQGVSLGALVDGLQTQSQFSVRHAVVHGVDLAKAVKTIGLNRGGETRLDTLAGQVTTRGRAIQLSNLVASSGVLSATGAVTVAASRALSGRVNVNLGDKVGEGLKNIFGK
ncbi:AsmA-like C-terminal region-containing protein [Rhodoferax sp.]|uniref:AsmA-like C-terminal region-containing protein n=1 Tax=Rhodoferax sp. TaxID=50421 RepID=UPI00274FC98B|nr:AsmA-like C-terminal region-containing protein [Rhodoferax sp.]